MYVVCMLCWLIVVGMVVDVSVCMLFVLCCGVVMLLFGCVGVLFGCVCGCCWLFVLLLVLVCRLLCVCVGMLIVVGV